MIPVCTYDSAYCTVQYRYILEVGADTHSYQSIDIFYTEYILVYTEHIQAITVYILVRVFIQIINTHCAGRAAASICILCRFPETLNTLLYLLHNQTNIIYVMYIHTLYLVSSTVLCTVPDIVG